MQDMLATISGRDIRIDLAEPYNGSLDFENVLVSDYGEKGVELISGFDVITIPGEFCSVSKNGDTYDIYYKDKLYMGIEIV